MAIHFNFSAGAGLVCLALFTTHAFAQDDEVLPPGELDPLLPAQTMQLEEDTAESDSSDSDTGETGTEDPVAPTDGESADTQDTGTESSDPDTTEDRPTDDSQTSDETNPDDAIPGESAPGDDSTLPENQPTPETVQTTVVSDDAQESDQTSTPDSNLDLTPVLNQLTDHTITVGESLEFVVSATIADGNIPGIFATQLPTGASLTDRLDGTRLFKIDAVEGNAGDNPITFVAFNESNPLLIDEITITITVNSDATAADAGEQEPTAETPVDQAIFINPVPAQTANVGDTVSVRVEPEEPNGPVPDLFALNLPEGATLDDNLDGTRTFNWKPMDGDSGVYMIDFVATNPDNNDIRATERLIVTVLSNAVPLIEIPLIEPLDDHQITVNTMMILRVTPIGVNNVVPDLNVSPLPVNASFDDNGDGTRTLRWRPTPGAEGTYTITFIATDPVDRSLVGRRSITVQVLSDGSIPTTDEITQPVPQPDPVTNEPDAATDTPNSDTPSSDTPSSDTEDQTDTPEDTTADDTNSDTPVEPENPVEMPAEEPVTNPDDAAPSDEPAVTMTREEFAAALPGSRYDECRITVPGVESERTVETFTNELYILDYYFFRNVDCSGIPFGSSNPLLIYGYTIGESVITDDGRQAFEIDLQVEQTGQIGGDDFGEPEGTRAYDIIAKEGNSVLFAEAISSTTPETRPTLLQTALPSENRPMLGKPDITPADFTGNWQSNCLNSQTVQYEFSDEQLRQNNITWDSSTCDGSVHHNLETIYSISFGEQSRSLFGDYILPVDIETVSSEFLQRDDSAGAPAAPPLPPIGMKSYQIVTLEQDTLMFGTCSFIGGCLETEATRPDMVHLNNGRRWQRAP